MEDVMKVSKWGNSLAIRIPADVAENLGFAEGDQVLITHEHGKLVAEKPKSLEQMLTDVRKLRGAIPANFKFDREEANARGA
jgi:antitoxin MazE